MNNRTKIGSMTKASIFLSIFIALSGMAAITLADDITPTPNRFSGTVTLNGAPAPNGTVINAFIDGGYSGCIVVESPGEYEYLSVNGSDSDDGKNVTFTLCGAAAEQNGTWTKMIDHVQVLNLTAVDNVAPAVTNATATPSPIVADGVETTQLNVTILDGCKCTVGIVTVDLSAIGGDDAQEISRIGDTDVYSVTVSATEGTAPGAHCLYVNASDVFGNYNPSVCVVLDVTDVSIEAQFTIHLDAGWNMVSVPAIPADASVDAIFGDSITQPVYEYDAGYKPVTTLESMKGYWVLANSQVDIGISGTLPSDRDVTVVPGWNMIGPVSSGVQVDSFTDVILPVYGYAAGYNQATTLEQTEGYWLLASAETTITV